MPILPLVLVFLLFQTAHVHGQEGAATLRVVVQAEETLAPLRGAQVSFPGLGWGGVTDERGEAIVGPLPPGVRTVEVRFLGYATQRATVDLRPGRMSVLEVLLAPQPIALAPLRVRGERDRSLARAMGFYERRDRGPRSSFLTREEIEARSPGRLSDMVGTLPGVRAIPGPFRDARITFGRTTGSFRCPIQYFIDGVPVHGFEMDDVPPGNVDGLEIYRGASVIPPQFNRGTSLCGVIVIWTRSPP